jgi:hypothetical protein
MQSLKAKLRYVAAFAALGMFLSLPAAAAVIDFQSEAVGPYAGDTVTLSAGSVSVMFSGLELNIRDLTPTFPAGSSRVLSTRFDGEPITAEFLGGVTTDSVQIRNWISGVYTGEVDTIKIDAYDVADVLIGSVTSSAEFITINAVGIAKLIFDDPDGTGYVLDEFTFDAEVVPEPSSYGLMAVGAALVTWIRRRAVRS